MLMRKQSYPHDVNVHAKQDVDTGVFLRRWLPRSSPALASCAAMGSATREGSDMGSEGEAGAAGALQGGCVMLTVLSAASSVPIDTSTVRSFDSLVTMLTYTDIRVPTSIACRCTHS